jgi:hypothetical protein
MLFVLIEKIRRKDVSWRLVAAFGVIAFVLALLSFANELPLTLFSYDTASPLSAYLTNQVILGILGALGTGAGIAFVVAAAEPIYRERFPSQISLGAAFSFRGLQTKAFFRSVSARLRSGRVLFRLSGGLLRRGGAFRSLGAGRRSLQRHAEHGPPWATVLLIGFLPAVSEEGISRMFSISFLDRLGLSRWIAVALPAFIWGFGHSTYPNQPFYIRGLEVGMAGVLIGFLMLRFGVVPLLVWHFTVDAIYTALLLLRSQNAYYVISGAIASGILLLPLLISLVLYARRGGFLSAAGLANADAGSVPAPPEEAVPLAEIPDVRPLPPGVLAVMGVTALLLVAACSFPRTPPRPSSKTRPDALSPRRRRSGFSRSTAWTPPAGGT